MSLREVQEGLFFLFAAIFDSMICVRSLTESCSMSSKFLSAAPVFVPTAEN